MSESLLIVISGSIRFAIPLADVQEILERPAVTMLPGLPAAIVGIVELREHPLPVVDPGVLAGFRATAEQRCVVVARGGAFGLLIDEVERIDEAADDRFSPHDERWAPRRYDGVRVAGLDRILECVA